ncbi:MAG: RNA polymerase sporulation sigma factor SigG [Clostridia bacterium]
MYNKVEICGINTSKLKVLTEEKKRELLKKAQSGDKKSREELISGNLKLVLSVIQSFSSRANPDDLFQVGCIGLIKSVDNFNLDMDVKFSTYAYPMILGELRRFLRDDNHLHVSRSLRDTAYKALQAKDMLSKKLSREATPAEIAAEMGMATKDVINALDSIVEPISLYEPVYSDSGDNIYVLDQISDKINTDEKWINDIAISEAIKKLSERERKILLLRFYSGKTQTEVSDEIGISQAQVSRLEKNALGKVKKEL